MGLFSSIMRTLGLNNQEAFRRWSTSELEEKKVYLENKPTEKFNTKDNYLVAEWVIQRYLPEGDDPTPEEWTKIIGAIRKNIDINLHKAAVGVLVKTEYIQPEPYALTEEDFLRDVVPTFSNFGLLPDPFLKDGQDRVIWRVLFEFTQPYSYRHVEAKDALIPFCDAYLAEKLVQDLWRTYTAARKSQQEGSTKMKVICSGKQCSSCLAMDGTKLSVKELLGSFKNRAPLFPHSLHNEKQVLWCPAPYLSPEIALRDGDDPDFHEVLLKILEQ